MGEELDEVNAPESANEDVAVQDESAATGKAASGDDVNAPDPAEGEAQSKEDGNEGGTESRQGEQNEAPSSDEGLKERREAEVAFSWQASEFVHHHKSIGWYLGLGAAVVVLVGAAVLLKLWLEVGLFLVMGGAIAVYAAKPPKTMLYELTPEGIQIEGKQYAFSQFRSFGVMKDDFWHSIDLEPSRRFVPRLTVLFDNDDFDSIVSHLELHMPRVDREPDVIERVSRYLRF